jgi:glutamine synthetase
MDGGDMLWMSRFLLVRVAEMYNVECTFDPKPIPGDWNGAGGHVNFSNVDTRTENTGWDAIQAQIGKLEKRHAVHIAQYGEVGVGGDGWGGSCVCRRARLLLLQTAGR